MGRTIPSFRLACMAEEMKWRSFRSRLDKDDRKKFDECFQLHACIIVPAQIPQDQSLYTVF